MSIRDLREPEHAGGPRPAGRDARPVAATGRSPPHPLGVPSGSMTDQPAEDRSTDGIIDVVALVGLASIVAGTLILGSTDLGFDRGAAVRAIAGMLPTTIPIGALVLMASVLDIGTGIVVARAIRGRPFERLDEAILAGFVTAVVKDLVLLGLAAQVGLFLQPLLIAVHVLVLAAGAVRLRPILAPGGAGIPRSITPFAVLVAIAWAAPVILQMASPIVPFVDVLPNHVAPVEHLRTFGSLGLLTDTQSPIYGPSRVFLGYTALLGTIGTMSGLPAGEALAGFILPSTLVVAAAVHRLARAIGGAGVTGWALLLFAMTTSFARLGDARATVVVLPLAAWVLASVADHLARPNGSEGRDTRDTPDAVRIHWSRDRFRDPLLLGLGVGAAVFMHPAIGFLVCLTLVMLVLARPAALAGQAVPALGIAATIALPQVATVVGIGLPPIALVVSIGVGLAAGTAIVANPTLHMPLVLVGRLAAAGAALAAVLVAGPLVRAAVGGAQPLLSVMELALVAGAVAVALRTPAARNPVLWAALGAGFLVAALTQLVPEKGAGLLGDALRFELPKTLHYWVPVPLAILAASGVAAVLRLAVLPIAIRGVAVTAFVAAAVLPIRTTPIDAFLLGEHRISETLSIAMRWSERGFWQGFPDTRYVVDAPRREILAAVRAEIEAGRIGPEAPILHIADSFQQWRATPLGVFTGVTETDVTPDAVVSIHTIGGRLRPLEDMAGLIAGRTYAYVLLEPSPDKLPPDARDQIVAAGYTSIFANAQGELFRLAAP